MPKSVRPEFRKWVDSQPDPAWALMPLTHICKSLIAGDIVRDGGISPEHCDTLGRSLAYFFYGRPAYRTVGDGPIKNPAACPMCFIFDPKLIERAAEIHPFDTGAHAARLYSHIVMEEMGLEDFSLERNARRPNRLINALYGSREAYFDSDNSKIRSEIAPPHEFLAHTYVELVRSTGRNEPDDRVGTIEVVVGEAVSLGGNLLAVVVPDIVCDEKDVDGWLPTLRRMGVEILPFRYLHGRDPAHHHAMIEAEVRSYYVRRSDI